MKGLHDLKEHAIIGTLSNGSVRLLIDMVGVLHLIFCPTGIIDLSLKAKHADLPWDVVFCSELLGAYKP